MSEPQMTAEQAKDIIESKRPAQKGIFKGLTPDEVIFWDMLQTNGFTIEWYVTAREGIIWSWKNGETGETGGAFRDRRQAIRHCIKTHKAEKMTSEKAIEILSYAWPASDCAAIADFIRALAARNAELERIQESHLKAWKEDVETANSRIVELMKALAIARGVK